jgi:hypothetical protein
MASRSSLEVEEPTKGENPDADHKFTKRMLLWIQAQVAPDPQSTWDRDLANAVLALREEYSRWGKDKWINW